MENPVYRILSIVCTISFWLGPLMIWLRWVSPRVGKWIFKFSMILGVVNFLIGTFGYLYCTGSLEFQKDSWILAGSALLPALTGVVLVILKYAKTCCRKNVTAFFALFFLLGVRGLYADGSKVAVLPADPDTQFLRNLLFEIGATGFEKPEVPGLKRLQWKGCEKVPPPKWVSMLLLDQPVRHEYHFGKNCDVQGIIIFRRAGFPVDLKVRNIPGENRVKAQVKMEAEPKLATQLLETRVFLSDGELLGPKVETKKFKANYIINLNFAGEVASNPGGQIEINGKSLPLLFNAH